jgi:hypothetical protein
VHTEFYLRTGLLHVTQIAIFVLALRVYLKRKETGFLVLAIGLGVHAMLAVVGLLSLLGAGPVFSAVLGKVSSFLLYGPLVLALIGWALLERKK